jgi:hypothetical protein
LIDSIGGRKVLVAASVTLLGVGAVFVKGDVPPGFLTLLQTIFAAFVVGNGIEHASSAYVEAKTGTPSVAPEAPPPAPNEEVVKELSEIKGAVATVQETLTAFIKRAFGT